MPLHVDIKINETLIETLHIGRLEGGTDPDDLNLYAAVVGEEPLTIEDWRKRGSTYKHRYGDGALVCVQKALEVIHNYKPTGWELDMEYNLGVIDEREHAAKIIKEHTLTDKSVAGFLKVCSCGEVVDFYQNHLAEVIQRNPV